jgi:threonine dehydrogenase-like Zn-dependent dehydrogenase
MDTMRGLYLPGGRRTLLRDDIAVPEPGAGQVLVAVRASAICGSDIRAIYREHLGTGPERYAGVIAGHEPAGQVVAAGPGCGRIAPGDRVAVYHIAGCGQCPDCLRGYHISCGSPARAAYGWQRDGGHADCLLAEERTCVRLPQQLTFLDGACVACGFGTAYEALIRLAVSGADSLLVTGLGPVGLAAGLIAGKLGATPVYGCEPNAARARLALDLGAVDDVLPPGAAGEAGVSAAIDCSGSPAGRHTAITALARWGRLAFVGEGGDVTVDVSAQIIHKQLTVIGSWVTSVGHMTDLTQRLAAWDLHPEIVVTDRVGLADAGDAYRLADQGDAGKVAIMPAQV